MKLDEAINLRRGTGLSGWEMVGYVNRLVNENMEYSVDIPFTMHRKAFQIGKGYCVQQAFCVRDILKTLGYRVQLVYCRKAIFKDTGTTSGHTWCRVSIDKKEQNVCSCHSDNYPGKVNFIPVSKVRKYAGPIVIGGYLGSIPVCFKRMVAGSR